MIVAGLLVLVVGVTGFGLWRVEASLDQDKAKILVLAEEFAQCFNREDTECLKAVSTWDEAAMDEGLDQAKLVRERLGARGKSAPIQNSWSMRKFSSLTSPITTKIRVTLETSYEHDPKAREWFELVEQKNTLRVRNFRVNSPKLQAPTQSWITQQREQP
jgi:hypothetical protein